MKKIFILLSFVLLAFSASAQQKEVTTALLTFDETEHHFGDIKQGDVVEHTFTFENTGVKPLVLTNVSVTCGCTAPQWPREPIAPGEEAEIVIRFNSAGKMGKQHKAITIFSNAAVSQKQIIITTNVLPPDTSGN
jgi:hypothetical protein